MGADDLVINQKKNHFHRVTRWEDMSSQTGMNFQGYTSYRVTPIVPTVAFITQQELQFG